MAQNHKKTIVCLVGGWSELCWVGPISTAVWMQFKMDWVSSRDAGWTRPPKSNGWSRSRRVEWDPRGDHERCQFDGGARTRSRAATPCFGLRRVLVELRRHAQLQPPSRAGGALPPRPASALRAPMVGGPSATTARHGQRAEREGAARPPSPGRAQEQSSTARPTPPRARAVEHRPADSAAREGGREVRPPPRAVTAG